jgi:LPXTG-motif cell wall-anchored protein
MLPSGTALAQGDPAAGKTVYTSAGCGTCHTFKAAGSTGTIGPNLDTTKPTYSKAVSVVTNGAQSAAGVMPAFKGTLTTAQIADVAAFVSGTGGSPTTTAPAQTTPAQTTPAQTTPAQTTPAQTTPAQTTPAQTTPAPTTPAQTTPAQTTPAQTTPTTTAPLTPPSSGGGGAGGGAAPGGTLPSTGFDVMPLAALAAGLCVVGLALLLWRPRKRGATH